MGSGINSVGAYYFDDNSVLKYLRKVLAEINPGYVDCGIRSAFLLKRYIERYKVYENNPEKGSKLALLCMLKDIGTYYKSGEIPRSNHALAAASSYSFMHNCAMRFAALIASSLFDECDSMLKRLVCFQS